MNTREIKLLSESVQLSSEQRDIIVGLLLGDGHLETLNQGRTYRLRIEHSFNQKEYVDWLFGKFSAFTLSGPHTKRQMVKGKEYSKCYFTTIGTGKLRYYGKLFYPHGKKQVPEIIDKLATSLSIAIWFMDDGSLKSKHHKARILNTQGFSDTEVQRLREMLLQKFSIATLIRRQKEGTQIYIPSEEVEKFISLIRPFIIPAMEYKIKLTQLHKE